MNPVQISNTLAQPKSVSPFDIWSNNHPAEQQNSVLTQFHLFRGGMDVQRPLQIVAVILRQRDH